MAAAWIGFASGIVAAIVAVVLAIRQARTDAIAIERDVRARCDRHIVPPGERQSVTRTTGPSAFIV